MTQEAKQGVTHTFDTVAAGYDHPAVRFFASAADHLIGQLRPTPGQEILDVAAGTGVVTVAAAQAVGTDGRVIAIDLSKNMLQQAEQTTRKLGLTQVDTRLMDAENLEFDGNQFDHTICSFGLFFMPDMARALREWTRVTRPGGTVAFTSFGTRAFQPMTTLLLDRLERFGVTIPADRNQMGWYPLATDARGLPLLAQAGLVDARVQHVQMGYHLPSVQDWWTVCWNAGYRGLLMQLDEADGERFREEYLLDVADLADDQGIWMDVEVLFYFGTKPVSDT